MKKERHAQLDKDIAAYLYKSDYLRAYTLLYCFLQGSDDEGVSNYSRAELRFDQHPTLGPNKRNPGLIETDVFLEMQCESFGHYIESKSESQILTLLEQMNSILLIMILDWLLNKLAESEAIPFEEVFYLQGESYYLLTHAYPSNRDIKASHQAGSLKLVVRWNHIVKVRYNEHEIRVHSLETATKKALQDRLKQESGELRIFSAEEHRVDYDWTLNESSMRFRFIGYKSDDSRQRVLKCLEQANELRASIVIFPELSVSEKLREAIKVWLALENHCLLLVIAGSWHIPVNETEYVNEAVIFDSLGCLVMPHRKATTYSFKADSKSELAIHEDIVTSNILNLIMFPFGLTTMLICKDFCDLLSRLQDTIKYCAPEFIFLPTMGDDVTMAAHDRAYRNLSVSMATTLVCSNQTPKEMQNSADCPGRLYSGIHNEQINQELENDKRSTSGADNMDNNSNEKQNEKADLFSECPENGLYRIRLRF